MTKKSKTIRVNHLLRLGICVALIAMIAMVGVVMASAEEPVYSEGLEFTSNGDGTCILKGIGTCTDTEIVIPPVSPEGDVVTEIDRYAIYIVDGLESITIPVSVTRIGKQAFDYCNQLTSIIVEEGNPVYHSDGNCLIHTESKTLIKGCPNSVIPDDGSVTIIGEGAFLDYDNLTSIVIPEGVTRIEGGVFYNCEGLTSITIPESVTYIDNGTFRYCSNLTSIVVANGNPIYHVMGNCLIHTESKTLVAGCMSSIIPNDGSITSIGEFAFAGHKKLTAIHIPASVTKIGWEAFEGCSGLVSVTFDEDSQLETIREFAFEKCINLKRIDIPEGVTYLWHSTFAKCENLESITFSNNMQYICSLALSDCKKLIEVENGVGYVNNWVIDVDLDSERVRFREGTVGISESACWSYSYLTHIWIPDSMRVIHAWMLATSDVLTHIYYGGTEKDWESKLIGWDSDLDEVSFHYNTYFDAQGVAYVPNGDGTCYVIGFNSCIDTEIVIPSVSPAGDTVTSIGPEAFEHCHSLESIVIPKSVKWIPISAFYECNNLKSIVFENTNGWVCHNYGSDEYHNKITWGMDVTDSAANADFFPVDGEFGVLNGAAWLERIPAEDIEYDCGPCGDNLVWRLSWSGHLVIEGIGDMWDDYSFGFYKNKIRDVVIPEGVTSIGDSAFRNCSLLTSVSIPEGMISIGDYAFAGCAGLTSVVFPKSLTYLGEGAFCACLNLKSISIPEGITEIKKYTFADCQSLTTVIIPDGVTCIGSYVFVTCRSLTYIEIPQSVEKIGEGSFMSCEKLESITFPEKLTQIESEMFLGCENLKSFVIPPNVTSIGDEAFEHCHSLESIVIPKSVKWIPISVFYECDNLKSIVFENTYGWVCHDYGNNEMVTWTVDVKDSAANAKFFPADGEFDGFFGGAAWLEFIPASFNASLRMWVNHDNTPAHGFVICTDGYVYYCENGKKIPYAGLVEREGNYYYINDYGRPFAGGEKYITRTNGLTLPDGTPIPQGRYFFDEEGRMQLVIKQGLVDGVYYEDNLPVPYAGLIYQDGNYYYINDNARPFAGGEKYITRINGLTLSDGTPIPEGRYVFDADGKMQLVIKQGLVDGVYYEDNLPVPYAGLINQDDHYYYINDYAKPVANRRYYITNTHGLLPVGWYEFDSNGILRLNTI